MVDPLLFLSSSSLWRMLLLIALILVFLKKKKNQIKVQRWKKSLNLTQHKRIFNRLFHNIDGFNLSRIARQQQNDCIDYTYGEIDFLSFIALLSLIPMDKNTIFYDLGSGTGKAVIACAMVYPVHKSIGVELFSSLHDCAYQQKHQLEAIMSYKEKATKIDFVLGNFLKVNLSEATLIFVNSSTLFGITWEKLCLILDNQARLNTVITTSRPLICKSFFLQITTQIQMSWGIVLAYIHLRKTN